MSYIGNSPTSVAFLTDLFTGTGSLTTFTMSTAPASTSSMLVSITGIVQEPSTYAITGTTLTFSQAPPAGTGNISVRYLGIPASGVISTAYKTVTEFTATLAQTIFTVPSYTVGYITVYRNGVRLGTADYTASSGTNVILTVAANTGDLVTTESFYVSSVLNAIPAVVGSVIGSYMDPNITLGSPSYTGTLTGSTGVLNIGSGQIYKNGSGNVGIGLTNPKTYSNMHIRALNNSVLVVEDSGAGSGYFSQLGTVTNLASEAVISFSNGVSFASGPAASGTERMRLDISGNLLLGTTVSPSGSNNLVVAGSISSVNTFGFKNRIINGGMVIDQRNAGASVTPTAGQYLVDRWYYQASQTAKFTAQQNAGSVTPPVGFSKYLGVTSSSAYSITSTDYFELVQRIEGFNTADLAFGTINAATVTLSFWVRSSLTGTFGASISNGQASRSYPFSYSIPVANTWTQISVTVAGDTTGTWNGATNDPGMQITFSLGMGSTFQGTANTWTGTGSIYLPTGTVSVVGTSGATFYITGVQLEKGSVATSFDYRPYGTELALCQRYYLTTGAAYGNGVVPANSFGGVSFPVQMRAAPTVTITAYSGSAPAVGNVCSTGAYFNSGGAAGSAIQWNAAIEL